MSNSAKGVIAGLHISGGGVPKLPVSSGYANREGLEGDQHRDLRFHGGPQRALCLFSMEVIERLNAEGHPIQPGATGENVTLRGVDWQTVRPGMRYRLGEEVEIEITDYTTPCQNIKASFKGEAFSRILQKKHPGESRVYARVLKEGAIAVGDSVAEITSETA